MKTIICIAGLALVVCSCTSKKEEVADYKKYTNKTFFDGVARYYIFNAEDKREGEQPFRSKAIRSIIKVDENTFAGVEHTYYSDYDTIVRGDSTVMEVRKDGIYTIESYVNGGTSWKKLEMRPVLTIPWKWDAGREVEINWHSTFDGKKVSVSSKRAFTEFQQKQLQHFGKETSAVRHGSMKRKVDGELMESEVEIWDVEGLGLYRYQTKSDRSLYIMEYEKEISQETYNLIIEGIITPKSIL